MKFRNVIDSEECLSTFDIITHSAENENLICENKFVKLIFKVLTERILCFSYKAFNQPFISCTTQLSNHKLNCNSSHVIYLGTCKKCRGQYVGKTKNAFKKRHSGHKQEVKNIIGGLGHHYGGQNGCGYGNISIQIIDQVEQGDLDALAERETYWQNQLHCYVEHGSNAVSQS